MTPRNDDQQTRGGIFGRWADRHKAFIYLFLLFLVFMLLAGFPLLTVTVNPGQGGVYYNRLLGGTDLTHTYGEGIHLVLPWNRMYVYNTRLQEATVEVNTLSLGGLRADLDISVIYRPVPEELPYLHVLVGEDYAGKLVIPTVKSTARFVMTYYDPGTLYGASPANGRDISTGYLQSQIFDAVQESLSLKHIHVESIFVKKIALPDFVEEAINKKYMAEQDYLRYRYILAKTKEALKVGYVQAETARLAADVLSGSLSPAYLRYLGILATRDLAASANAKLVVVGGGEDGLPLILNMGDAAQTGPGAPAQSPNGLSSPALDDLKGELEAVNNFDRIRPLLESLENQIPDQSAVPSTPPLPAAQSADQH